MGRRVDVRRHEDDVESHGRRGEGHASDQEAPPPAHRALRGREGAREGARVGDGAVLGAGCILTGTIPVIDAETGDEISRGVVPGWCVAVLASRTRSYPGGEYGLPCVLVVKRLDQGARHDKAKLNDVLREHGGTL